MDKLEEKIGYAFQNRDLLRTALTHSSYANEKHADGLPCYERLEFLGDSILGLVTADFLYHHEPPLPEGSMTRLRAELVCEQALHKVALELGIAPYMRLGRGEEHTGGRERASVLADMVESIIAALYLDSGLGEARRFILERSSRTRRSVRPTAPRTIRPNCRSWFSASPTSRSTMSSSGRAGPTTTRPSPSA